MNKCELLGYGFKFECLEGDKCSICEDARQSNFNADLFTDGTMSQSVAVQQYGDLLVSPTKEKESFYSCLQIEIEDQDESAEYKSIDQVSIDID